MKRKAKAILLLWTMAGLLAGCHRQDAIENTIENTDEQLTYRADDPVETEVGGNEIGNNTEPSEETEVQETEEDSAESTGIETEDAESGFYCTALTEDIKARITGSSYPDTQEPLQISYEELSYVHVLHYDFEGQIQEGELICNQAVAQDLVEIFYELYESQYPIEKIRLIDEYSADDEASMADNNTSCFNYRPVEGSTRLSRHALGLAVDINPLYNPYITYTEEGEENVLPASAAAYADRSAGFPYKIDENDLCYKLFIQHGFTWGGNWNNVKDYQHFQKTK